MSAKRRRPPGFRAGLFTPGACGRFVKIATAEYDFYVKIAIVEYNFYEKTSFFKIY